MKEHYLRSVRGLMDCPPEEKDRLLSRLGDAITAYLEDVPESSEAELFANFGAPEDCAARLLAECSPSKIAAQRQKNIRRYHILATVLAMLLAIALCLAAYLWSNGGLVIIRTTPVNQEYWDNLPSNNIIYDYDD